MLTLTEQPIGTGRHRKCYRHPQDPAKCIKIVYNMGTGGKEELERELAYYRHLNGYLTDWSGIPRYWGEVQTDQGKGYVYESILDADGTPSETLAQYISRPLTAPQKEQLAAAFRELHRYLHDNRIVTMTIKPYNVLAQKLAGGALRLVVCDNLSEASLIPVATWIGAFARMKLARNWKRFTSIPAIRDLGLKI